LLNSDFHFRRAPNNQAQVVQPLNFVLGTVASNYLFTFLELAAEVLELEGRLPLDGFDTKLVEEVKHNFAALTTAFFKFANGATHNELETF
jgi:hypothetical protein